LCHPDVSNNQPQTAWETLAVKIFIYEVALAGTALLAFNTVQCLRIADAVKLGDKNYFSNQFLPYHPA